jgi:hypothetical protein
MEKCGILPVSFGLFKATCTEKPMDNGGEKRI